MKVRQPGPLGSAPNRSAIRQRIAYRLLVATAKSKPSGRFGSAWTGAWIRATAGMTGSSRIRIHRERVTVNTGYAYPAFSRRWPFYNAPLVELVWQTHATAGRKVTLVDVGAAVGDTALLVMAQCPDAVDRFVCIEPDPEFYGYLTQNLGSRRGVVLVDQMLSDTENGAPDLVRIHSGTASAQGDSVQPTTTLDQVLLDEPSVDIIKIDTDGFDGRVLAGSKNTLARHAPSVIFEWHPILIDQTGQDPMLPFRVLEAAGYDQFVWFTKEGKFSHVMSGFDELAVSELAILCRSGQGPEPDWHFDVVALPSGRRAPSADAISDLVHARKQRRL